MSVDITTTAPAAIEAAPAAAPITTQITLPSGNLKISLAALAIGNLRPATPILAAVKFMTYQGELWAETFNYETHVRQYIGTVDFYEGDDFAVLVPHATVTALIKGIAGTRKVSPLVTLTIGPETFQINDGANLAWADVRDYPTTPLGPNLYDDHYITMDTKAFVASMNKLYVSASTDDTLPILTSFRFELAHGYLTGMTTDRYRLTRVGFEGVVTTQESKGALMSAKLWKKIRMVLKSDTTHLAADGDWVKIVNGGLTIQVQTVDGDYPKIASLFPDSVPNVTILPRTELVAAVNAAVLVAERNTPVLMEFEDGTVTLTAQADQAHVVGRIKYEGTTDVPRQAFNPQYLLEAIKSFDGDTVAMGQTAAPKPVIFAEHGHCIGFELEHNHLLMPVRLPSL